MEGPCIIGHGRDAATTLLSFMPGPAPSSCTSQLPASATYVAVDIGEHPMAWLGVWDSFDSSSEQGWDSNMVDSGTSGTAL